MKFRLSHMMFLMRRLTWALGLFVAMANVGCNSSKTSSAGFTTPGASLPNCSRDGQINCVATQDYIAVDASNLKTTNIKTGITIGGVNGQLMAEGASDVPKAWDLRVGVTVNGVVGKLRVNCRNNINSSIFNYDGAASAIGDVTVQTGTALDVWDTIDDFKDEFTAPPAQVVPTWGDSTNCGAVSELADNAAVWKDVTTTAAGATSTCVATAARCTLQDNITGLWWSKLIASGESWDAAISACSNLDHNGQSDWRLPTQKELMEAYVHGARSAASDNWVSVQQMLDSFWSSTSGANDPDYAWMLNLGTGSNFIPVSKSDSYSILCVR